MSGYEMLDTLEKKVHPQNAALIVIDMENDFCARDGAWDQLGEKNGILAVEQMTPTLLNLINEARKAGVLVIFIQAIYDEQFRSMPMKEQYNRRVGGKFYPISGTWGAEFYKVQPQKDDIIVQKHRYSAFANTELDLILRSKSIQTLILTGVATNGCVNSTAHDGFFLDYYIVVPENCNASYSEELRKGELWIIDRIYGVVPKSEDIITIWRQLQTGS
ncbi:cysteine hydrolase family protein [Chloroflexota bacterium]